MKNHAILSPSAAHRWLICTPSARLEQDFPDSSNQAADEGTLWHVLNELLLGLKLKKITQEQFDKEFTQIQQHELYQHEMLEHSENFATFVLERFTEAQVETSDAAIHLEHQLNLTDYIPEGFGTGDVIIVADKVLELIDGKYGKGVHVAAEENEQLMLYGLGALRDYDFIYGIKTVRLTIFQPRIDNYSSWDIEVKKLRRWAAEQLIPKAALAFEGKGQLVPGDHCRFCKVKPRCKALADYNMKLAAHKFSDPNLLDDAAISNILGKSDLFKDWIKAVEDYALSEAVNHDKHWEGFKLVEGRSNRKYADENDIKTVLSGSDISEDDYSPRQLLGITAMEKLLGKVKFSKLLSGYIIKPPGKPTLVPSDDKRPELNSNEAAKKAFS